MRDMKLMRLSVTHRWLWVAILSASRESPIPGKLMLSQTVAVDELGLSQYANLRVQDVRTGLKMFQELRLIYWDDTIGTWTVTAWSARQFESDDVTARTSKHRSQEQGRNVPTPFPGTTLEHTRDRDRDRIKEDKSSLAEQGKHNQPQSVDPDEVDAPVESKAAVAQNTPATPIPKAKPTRQSRSTTTATTSGGEKVRRRDPLFDAMALACGHDLENLTKSEGTAIGSAVSEIRHQPDVTPELVWAKAALYRALHPTWELTPRALVKHWSSLQPQQPQAAASRDPRYDSLNALRDDPEAAAAFAKELEEAKVTFNSGAAVADRKQWERERRTDAQNVFFDRCERYEQAAAKELEEAEAAEPEPVTKPDVTPEPKPDVTPGKQELSAEDWG
jgi:hypothetical protein